MKSDNRCVQSSKPNYRLQVSYIFAWYSRLESKTFY